METIEIKTYDGNNPEYTETKWGAFHIVKRKSNHDNHTQVEYGFVIANDIDEAETIKRELEEASKETKGWYYIEIVQAWALPCVNIFLVFASRYTRYNATPISKEEFYSYRLV